MKVAFLPRIFHRKIEWLPPSFGVCFSIRFSHKVGKCKHVVVFSGASDKTGKYGEFFFVDPLRNGKSPFFAMYSKMGVERGNMSV